MKEAKKILVTGSAGFIGFHLTKRLLEEGNIVVGIDNINEYYDPELKFARLQELGILKQRVEWGNEVNSDKYEGHKFVRLNLQDKEALFDLFEKEKFNIVVNLAAQAGVRYSIDNPDIYIESNLIGFYNLLEACRYFPVEHLIYASSSSVYGDNHDVPFKETANVDQPISLYAATKKSNELLAYTYSHLFNIRTTGLRFFTVYGPWGRPDMALALFTKNILEGTPIKVFNNGDLSRDFTFIDDIVKGVISVANMERISDYQLFNIGNNSPIQLMHFIKAIENELGNKAKLDMLPMQPGDVHQTWADTSELEKYTEYKPSTSIKEGVEEYVKWFLNYYKSYTVPS